MKDDMKIISMWVDAHRNQGDGPLEKILRGESNVEATPTGKWYIRKSKYRIVNWWRKITGTEIIEQEFTYKWKV